MIVIPFRVSIPPSQQDPLLKEKLKKELPGILLWALEGLMRLRRNQTFTMPTVCQEALEDYRQESNPAKTFLVDMCREDPAGTVGCASLYESYRNWAVENRFEVLDSRQFGKEVRKAFPRVRRERARKVGRERSWVYHGVAYDPSGPINSIPTDRDERKRYE